MGLCAALGADKLQRIALNSVHKHVYTQTKPPLSNKLLVKERKKETKESQPELTKADFTFIPVSHCMLKSDTT